MDCGLFASSRRNRMWCHSVSFRAERRRRGVEESPSSRKWANPSTDMIAIPRLRARFACATLGMTIASIAHAQKPDRDYHVLVASEAVDLITHITFGPNGAKVTETTKVGINPMDPDGPHGVGLSPNGQQYYVSTAHGVPYGYLWKIDTKTNEVLGNVELGNFPATLQVSPDGGFIYVVNFNLHGEMVPSNVSVVSTDPLVEVARIQTCTMPHGSRLNPAGTKHYSACMM